MSTRSLSVQPVDGFRTTIHQIRRLLFSIARMGPSAKFARATVLLSTVVGLASCNTSGPTRDSSVVIHYRQLLNARQIPNEDNTNFTTTGGGFAIYQITGIDNMARDAQPFYFRLSKLQVSGIGGSDSPQNADPRLNAYFNAQSGAFVAPHTKGVFTGDFIIALTSFPQFIGDGFEPLSYQIDPGEVVLFAREPQLYPVESWDGPSHQSAFDGRVAALPAGAVLGYSDDIPDFALGDTLQCNRQGYVSALTGAAAANHPQLPCIAHPTK
ncbi:hypothetical protein [Paraburkholderia flagellata]|uniref:hypothetical protein n=1 Tax=Paraburkholderia flagellata TaxID=2883241 RepID=UPI001F22DDAE|nr:hypothetical protein [Paraburkholderia flagellata]